METYRHLEELLNLTLFWLVMAISSWSLLLALDLLRPFHPLCEKWIIWEWLKQRFGLSNSNQSQSLIYALLYRHYVPGLIFMLRFSRIRAKRVVVNWTFPSVSTGMFIRISFLYASRYGHLFPKPSGGSMFLSMSNISV